MDRQEFNEFNGADMFNATGWALNWLGVRAYSEGCPMTISIVFWELTTMSLCSNQLSSCWKEYCMFECADPCTTSVKVVSSTYLCTEQLTIKSSTGTIIGARSGSWKVWTASSRKDITVLDLGLPLRLLWKDQYCRMFTRHYYYSHIRQYLLINMSTWFDVIKHWVLAIFKSAFEVEPCSVT